MILSRRSLLASLGLALPALAAPALTGADAASASTVRHAGHAARRHLHASGHAPHHRKPRHAAGAARFPRNA